MSAQKGFTLIEAAVACGIIALTILVLFFAAGAFSKFGAHASGPNRAAATLFAEQTLRVAQNAWKYGAIGNAPVGTWSTTLAIAGAGQPASIPVTVTTSLANSSATSAAISITVTYPPDPDRNDPGSVSASGTLRVRAPLPGTRVSYPALVPLPPGAP